MPPARHPFDLERLTFKALWSICGLYVLRQNRSEPQKNVLQFDSEDDATKAQFLEQLAWVLSTGVGADYVTAVGLEFSVIQMKHTSPKFRIARNKELQAKEMDDIKQFLANFRDSCNSDCPENNKFERVLVSIIALKLKKLMHYMENIMDQIENLSPWPELKSLTLAVITHLQQGQVDGIVPKLINLEDTLKLSIHNHEGTSQVGFQTKLKAVVYLEKLLRCNKAARTLLSCATKCATLLDASNDIRNASFPVSQKRCKGKDIPFPRLVYILHDRDPNIVAELNGMKSRLTGSRLSNFNDKCSDAWQNGYAHAEMQLLSFYDIHRHIVQLSPNYIGISRFACYYCQKMLSEHSNIQNKGSHQKVYWKWRAPGSVSHAQLDHIWASRLDRLAKDNMQQIERDLVLKTENSDFTRLTVDSYAESTASGISNQILSQAQVQLNLASFNNPISVADNAPDDPESTHTTGQNTSTPPAEIETNHIDSSRIHMHSTSKYKDMVLLLYRLREPWKRDIVSIQDFLIPGRDGEQALPDWNILVDRITGTSADTDDGVNLNYDHKTNVLILGKRIVIYNERQLIPALDYFVNAGERNIHGILCKKAELPYLGEENLLLC